MTTSPRALDVSLRPCPACQESVPASAQRCERCGKSILEIEHIQPIAYASSLRKKWLRLSLSCFLIAVFIVSSALLLKPYIVNSNFWVQLHSDVMWHREWQDNQIPADRTKIVELYEQILQKHPEDGNWHYIAIRALPDGAEKRRRMENAAIRFPKNPWILWGVATSYSTAENKDEPEQAAERYVKSIDAFGKHIPGFVLGYALASYATLASTESYIAFYSRHKEQINNTGEAASGMAVAEWSLGHMRSALRWEAKAQSHGVANQQKIKNTALIMGAVNLRNDINGSHGSCTTEVERLGAVPVVEVTDFVAKDEGEKYLLIFWLNYLAFDDTFNGSITRDDLKLQTASGVKYSSWIGSTANATIEARKNTQIMTAFEIPKFERVSKLILDTKREWKSSGSSILLEIPLASDSSEASLATQENDGSIEPE